jgi:ribose transport system substrate-binding protein
MGSSDFDSGGRRRRWLPVVGLVTVGVLGVAACGSGSSGSAPAAGSSPSASSGSGGADLSGFQSGLAAFEAVPKYDGPTSGPKPQPGKSIAVVECAAVNTGCAAGAAGVKSAATAAGWTTTIYDGQGTPAGASAAMVSAVAKHVDGIVLLAIASPTIIQGMTAAKKAGIPVVSVVSDNPVGSGSGDVYSEVSGDTVDSGKAIADYFVVASKGTAVAASFHIPSLVSTVNRYKGFINEFSKCSGCKIVSDQKYGIVSQAQFTNIIKATMNAHPNIQYIFVDVSQYATIAANALKGMGLSSKVGVAGVDCLPAEVQSIKDGTGEVACSNDALSESGYATVNEMIRGIAKVPPLHEAIPLRLLDKQIVSSDTPPYLGGFTPATGYLKLWGKS